MLFKKYRNLFSLPVENNFYILPIEKNTIVFNNIVSLALQARFQNSGHEIKLIPYEQIMYSEWFVLYLRKVHVFLGFDPKFNNPDFFYKKSKIINYWMEAPYLYNRNFINSDWYPFKGYYVKSLEKFELVEVSNVYCYIYFILGLTLIYFYFFYQKYWFKLNSLKFFKIWNMNFFQNNFQKMKNYVNCSFVPLFTFQDPATPIAEGIIDIHRHIFFFLIVIFLFVLWIMQRLIYEFWYETLSFNKNNKVKLFLLSNLRLSHNTTIELVWTIMPCVILYLIAIPSFLLLYSMDESIDPAITLKAIGHQWYWSYEYDDYKFQFESLAFDSYMLPEEDLSLGQLRLLEVDNPIVLPIYTHIRLIVTATDVLHCWAVPSLGVKVDAVPGRLNQGSIFLKRLGIFYGQCSEICGVNHGFMPIVVKSVKLNNYINWIINKI